MKQPGCKMLNSGRTYGIQKGVCFYSFERKAIFGHFLYTQFYLQKIVYRDLHLHISIQTVYITMKTQVALAFLVLVALSYFVDNSESAPAQGRQKRSIACSCPPTSEQLAANCKLPY